MPSIKEAKIQLIGHIDVPDERADVVKAALPEHIRLTLAEKGCVSFSVTPSPDVAGRFNVAEVFINQAAFDQHQSRAKQSDWARITAGIAREYRIEEVD